MTDVDALLQAEDVLGALRAIIVGGPSGDFGVDTTGAAKEETLLLLLAAAGTLLTGGGQVALDPATLAALESIIVSGEVSLSAGSLTALENIGVTVANPTADPETGLATSAKQDTLIARLPAALDGGSLDVVDVFTGGEALADQTGDGTAKTFTFASPVDLVWVRSEVVARADPFGGTPTASAGIPCAADEPNPITVRTSVVKVLAASGAISCWGYRS